MPRPPKEPKRKSGDRSRQKTAKERYEIFARLILNGGNLRRTAQDLGISRETIYKMLRTHREMYEEIKAEVKSELVAEVTDARRTALLAAKESINVSRALMRDSRTRSKIRAVEMAKTLEILDRVLNSLLGGGNAGSGEATDNPDPNTASESDADVAAILGEGPEGA